MENLLRDQGLALLRSFVWHADSTYLKRPRTDYMKLVRDQMTAQEQVHYELQRLLIVWDSSDNTYAVRQRVTQVLTAIDNKRQQA